LDNLNLTVYKDQKSLFTLHFFHFCITFNQKFSEKNDRTFSHQSAVKNSAIF